MKTLDKTSYDYIKKMINENDNIKFILAFVDGLGMDHKKPSSPVHYINGKLAITYRRKSEYFII